MSSVSKVVLAYSGGLDTSVIVKWLQQEYQCEVVTFTADIGQGEEVEPARAKAEALGVKEIYIDDLREEYARDFVFPMFRANTIYEGEYLLGTSIARPLIAKRLIEIANETNADAISHGATGKGNDQVRFELGAYALKPGIKVIAPWREWDLNSRDKLMDYCEQHSIPVEMKRGKKSPYSMDANLLHISYEGGNLEDPWSEAEDDMWRWTVAPEQAPDQPTYLTLSYEKGDIVAINGEAMSPATVIEHLNKIAGANGVGRLDIVENRYVGMKSRGCYETPAGTVMMKAHRAIESVTLDREVAHLKDELKVSSATTLSSTLTVNNSTVFKSRLSVESEVIFKSTLSVGNTVCIQGDLSISGTTNITGTLSEPLVRAKKRCRRQSRDKRFPEVLLFS